MKKFLRNLKIHQKLAFISMLILICFFILSAIIIYRVTYIDKMSTQLYENNGKIIDEEVELQTEFLMLRTDIMTGVSAGLYGDNITTNNKVKQINEKVDSLNEYMDVVNNFINLKYEPTDDYYKASINAILNLQKYLEFATKIADLLEDKKAMEAYKLVMSNNELINATVGSLDDMLEITLAELTTGLETMSNDLTTTRTTIIVLSLLTFVLSILINIFFGKLIKADIEKTLEQIKHFTDGSLDEIYSLNQSDEFGIISNGLTEASSFIQNIIEDIKTNTDEHVVKGTLHPQIITDNYEGDYKVLASSVQSIFDSNAEMLTSLINGFSEIANGEFTHFIPELPGEKMELTDTYIKLKTNLKGISSEIRTLANYASSGDLGKKAAADEYSGEWNALLTTLNDLLDSIEKPINESAKVINAFSEGILTTHMEGEYEGIFKDMQDNLNYTANGLSSYINEISRILGEISDNNLDVDVTYEFIGDFSEIKVSLLKITKKLNEVFYGFLESATEVSEASVSLTEDSISIANGSTEQVATVEELKSSVSLINESTSDTDENSTKASEMAENTRVSAVNGNKEMETMLGAMEEIKTASDNISNIIKVIDDIAFQTNLLALNASVEAARAGQHGKGFAVVAEEVRTLAERSKQAASETTVLINESLEKVNLGNNIANTTAQSLNTIVSDISKVSEILKEISLSSSSQSHSIDEIETNLSTFEAVIQNNAKVSENGVATAQELSAQAEILKSLIDQFNLKPEQS